MMIISTCMMEGKKSSGEGNVHVRHNIYAVQGDWTRDVIGEEGMQSISSSPRQWHIVEDRAAMTVILPVNIFLRF